MFYLKKWGKCALNERKRSSRNCFAGCYPYIKKTRTNALDQEKGLVASLVEKENNRFYCGSTKTDSEASGTADRIGEVLLSTARYSVVFSFLLGFLLADDIGKKGRIKNNLKYDRYGSFKQAIIYEMGFQKPSLII
ncbi:hypothetical protein TNCV_2363671 [Trichonephila clavipes]|nr:hypothetical protein TNCV_2363671 [Trichonephila clavipes]